MSERENNKVRLESVDAGDPGLADALTAARLPIDDLEEEGRHFFRVRRDGEAVGFGGYEIHGPYALLRSIVIVPSARGGGAGRAAVDLLLDRAFDDGAREAYLLTETAASFFEKLGFAAIDRACGPREILATRQAASLCPSSAALLVKSLAR